MAYRFPKLKQTINQQPLSANVANGVGAYGNRSLNRLVENPTRQPESLVPHQPTPKLLPTAAPKAPIMKAPKAFDEGGDVDNSVPYQKAQTIKNLEYDPDIRRDMNFGHTATDYGPNKSDMDKHRPSGYVTRGYDDGGIVSDGSTPSIPARVPTPPPSASPLPAASPEAISPDANFNGGGTTNFYNAAAQAAMANAAQGKDDATDNSTLAAYKQRNPDAFPALRAMMFAKYKKN